MRAALALSALAAVSLSAVLLQAPEGLKKWSRPQLEQFLIKTQIAFPTALSNEQLRDLVIQASARGLSSEQQHLTSIQDDQNLFEKAQHLFQDSKHAIIDFTTSTDAQIREKLLSKGIISSNANRPQLLRLAMEHLGLPHTAGIYNSASSALSAGASQATQIVSDVEEAVTDAFYATIDSPRLAYDYVHGALDDTKDYVYSTWNDNQLRNWANENLIDPTNMKRADLIASVKKHYNDNASASYESWSDSRLRKWLADHHVVQAKKAKGRDSLLDLLSQYYWSARDTTYHTWSDSQIHRWLVSRGLISPDAVVQRDGLLAKIEEHYYSLRDQSYSTWTNSQIRHYLRTRVGINDIPAEMPRFKLLEQIKEAYYDADETQFDRLSDGALRSLLINEGTLNATQASKLRRHELASFASRVYPTTQARNLLTPAAQQVWLRRHGHFFAHTDEEIAKSFEKYFVPSAPYLSWSDHRLRGYLRSHGVTLPMIGLTRHRLLEHTVANYVEPHAIILEPFWRVKSLFADSADSAVQFVKSSVNILPIVGEESRLAAKYSQLQASAIEDAKSHSAHVPSATPLRSRVYDSVTSFMRREKASATSLVSAATYSASAAVDSAASAYSSKLHAATDSALSVSLFASRSAAASMSSLGIAPAQISASAASVGAAAQATAHSIAEGAANNLANHLASAGQAASVAGTAVSSRAARASQSIVSRSDL